MILVNNVVKRIELANSGWNTESGVYLRTLKTPKSGKKLYSKKQKRGGNAEKFPEEEVKVPRVRERDCLQVTWRCETVSSNALSICQRWISQSQAGRLLGQNTSQIYSAPLSSRCAEENRSSGTRQKAVESGQGQSGGVRSQVPFSKLR